MTVDYQTALEKQQAKYNITNTSLHTEFTMVKQQALLVYRQLKKGVDAKVFHLVTQKLILRVQSHDTDDELMSLCFLSEQLPFNVISQLEYEKNSDFQPATDTREDTQQNEHEFFATDNKRVCKFVKVNDKWSQDKEATVKDKIKKCLVLPSD